MEKQDQYVGTTQGIFQILELLPEKSNDGHKMYLARCSTCGYVRNGQVRHLAMTTKCAHWILGGVSFDPKIRWKNESLQRTFKSIKQRCYSESDEDYRWYGVKGIKVCDEWLNDPISFEDWALASGYQKGLTIDRVDSDKDYCPENCRWISRKENSRCAGKVNWITANNLTMTGRQWSAYLGLGAGHINKYLRKHSLAETIVYIEAKVNDLQK